eukprot:gene1414-1835_t
MALIEARDLTKTYSMGDQAVHALAGVSLDIEAGEFVAIMGASGSGKSTLMNILGCLDRPTSGEYRLAGEPVQSLAPDALASVRNRRIGFVFQQFNLLPRTSALENVELPMVYAGVPTAERHQRARVALQRVGLADRSSHRPAAEVMQLLDALNRQGITVILVTHEADMAAWARRRLLFKDGRL